MGNDTDAIRQLAMDHVIRASADIELQLEHGARRGLYPVVVMLAKARNEAADAMVGVVTVDPHDAAAVTALQNEVRRFDDLVRWLREILIEGRAADADVSDDERDTIRMMFETEEGAREAAMLGIQQQDYEQ